MTPEEQAVIDAALRMHEQQLLDQAGGTPDQYLPDDFMQACITLERSHQPQQRWYLRTWADVRADDRVRLTAARDRPALVKSIMVLPWHVDPASARGRNPIAREWSECVITLDGDPRPVRFPPTAEIEIEMDVRTYEAMMLLGGWEQRIS